MSIPLNATARGRGRFHDAFILWKIVQFGNQKDRADDAHRTLILREILELSAGD